MLSILVIVFMENDVKLITIVTVVFCCFIVEFRTKRSKKLSNFAAEYFLMKKRIINEILIFARFLCPHCEHEQVSVKIFPFIARRTRYEIEFNYLRSWNSISELKFIPICCHYVILLDFLKLFLYRLLDRPFEDDPKWSSDSQYIYKIQIIKIHRHKSQE